MVVLKNCEPGLSYILVELFNKCRRESCFPDFWKVSLVFHVIQNVGEKLTARTYHPASLLSVVSKVFVKGLRSSQSTTDLLTVVSDRIARTFRRSWATQATLVWFQVFSINYRSSDRAFYGIPSHIWSYFSFSQ